MLISGTAPRHVLRCTLVGVLLLLLAVIGTLSVATSATAAPVVHPATAVGVAPDSSGYWMATSEGQVDAYGAPQSGALYPMALTKPVVGTAATTDGEGYYLVASDGGVFTFGDARYHGSTGADHLNRPIVGMAVDPATGGYWLVASDGGIFSFDAPFFGSTGSVHLNQPVVGMAPTPDGRGYYLVASDGGIFTFGDARFDGSTGAEHLNRPIVGMAVDTATGGYWLVASDGGIFSFDTPFLGSTGGTRLNAPIVSMTPTPGGAGYYLVAADGGVFTFGNAPFEGSPAGPDPYGPWVGLIVGPSLGFTPTALPTPSIGHSYSVTLRPFGGSGQYGQWEVTSGSLPPGLTLAPFLAGVSWLSRAEPACAQFNGMFSSSPV